jgi:cobalt/nickel transport system permease protein
MHIPDGYLGPATWIFLFLVMLVFWYFGFKNANKKLGPRHVPLLALMAALSFMLMMFNLPIPDGTTAHVVGAVMIAIIIGPYGAMIALTIALLIQALLFGDGGVTAFGANVFNMGVVMPFVGIFLYTGVRKAMGNNTRSRVVASMVGAYAGLVVAAVAAAVEFGIQPTIAPGYCPYGLDVALPAMFFTHLLVGFVEAIATGAVIFYIAENRPDILNLEKLAPKWMENMLRENAPEKVFEDRKETPLDAKV